jgi:hypothetical protein
MGADAGGIARGDVQLDLDVGGEAQLAHLPY